MTASTTHLLLIDDEAMQFSLVRGFLAKATSNQYEVTWAADSQEAYQQLAARDYDVCLLDYNLGGEDGLELLQTITQMDDAPPVIFMTGRGSLEVDIQAMSLGAIEYLEKTDLTPDLLERTVRYAVQRHKSYLSLLDSEDRLRTVLETVPAGVFVYQDGRLRYTNPMVSVMTHFTPEELAEMDLFDLVHPHAHDVVRRWLPLEGNYFLPSQPETKFRTAGGRERWFSLTMAAIQYDDKSAILGAIVDVTKRIRIEQDLLVSEKRFRALVEHSSDLIAQIDAAGQIDYISASITHILGYAESSWYNQQIVDYMHPDHHDVFGDAIALCLQTPHARPTVRVQMQHKHDHWVWMDIIISNMINTPGLHVILLNMRDVTEQQRRLSAERHQRAMAEALLDTFTTLNSTLNLSDIINRILNNVGAVVDHDNATMMLIEGKAANIVAQVGYPEGIWWQTTEFPIQEFPTLSFMQRTHEPLLIADVAKNSQWVSISQEDRTRSYIGVPIVVDEQVIGFLNLTSYKPNFFTMDSVQYLQLFCYQAGTALKNARSYEQAQELASLEERQRLARDLHDTVSQMLFSASMIADSLSRITSLDYHLEQGLAKLKDLNRGALAEMRTLLMELRPHSIINATLPTLIQNLTNSLMSRSTLQVDHNFEGHATLPEDVHIAVYRIIQEALNNIIKHAQAQHISIELTQNELGLHLVIADDGKGFDTKRERIGHHGLRIMRERAAKIGAELIITSSEAQGTTINMLWEKEERD